VWTGIAQLHVSSQTNEFNLWTNCFLSKCFKKRQMINNIFTLFFSSMVLIQKERTKKRDGKVITVPKDVGYKKANS
jgi:hypothetical protein